ncbi:type VI secretion system-associated FHA domain protein TagH [Psychromonas sp. psych-6C06]|uniref:type VI secretion system-associated FHA domain protein TagH n=1 Tax=Psychromonas sp. psych-6C06 TaxID=2058089 RepID=UPI000C32AD8B|nr:type VI secretion system-associated FHA domain protein TagH [Psychromonas sp. psych-6C06]PKF63490.1 type VI secretion system-associated FHA domain protein TagH [Psychromonas sp. psych-6C06]
MSIEITIIYSPDSVQISQPSFIFPEEGGTLGRAASNFWVLEDPNKYMSSVHAKISCEAGQYFLTDLSTNGTFINGASEPVGNGNQVVLNEGDHFTISDYEFVAKLSNSMSANMPFAAPENNDPFADFSAGAQSNVNNDFASVDPFKDDASDPFKNDLDDPFAFNNTPSNNDPFAQVSLGNTVDSIAPSIQSEAQTDPLALLDKVDVANNDPFSMASVGSDPFADVGATATNNLSDSVSDNRVMNESVQWPTASPEKSLIPDDWDDWDDDLLGSDPAPANTFQPSSIPEPVINQPQVSPASATPQTFASTLDSFNAVNGAEQVDDLMVEQPAIVNDPFAQPAQTSAFSQTQTIPDDPFTEQVEVELSPFQPTHDPVADTGPVASVASASMVGATATLAEPKQHNTHSEQAYQQLTVKNQQLELQNQQLRTEVEALKQQLLVAQQPAQPSTTPAMSASGDLNRVVDAMGLAKWNLDDAKKIQINDTVGLLMRETMQGMMQVLKFRKKIKEEFRINVTTIQSVENNPLKFSANIDDALENMFIKENNAYKAPVDAVKEGFQGIAEHQVAVVAGMQAAFRGLIERFDPNHLESRFEKYKSTSLLSLGSKTKRWNAYKEYHKGLVDNLDDSFQHLFGYDFVQAYEEQMQSLITARVTANNDEQTSN